MTKLYPLAQAQFDVFRIQAALKQFAADWLVNVDSVVRDETGKFASKEAYSVGETLVEDVEKIKLKAASVHQVLKEAIADPEYAKLQVSNELLKLASRTLDKFAEKDPEFTNKLLDRAFGLDAREARNKLADIYGEINPNLPNAIKPDPFNDFVIDLKEGRDPKELLKDAKRAFALTGFRYNKLLYDLTNIESESEFIKTMGKLAATSIPIAIYLSAVLTPEIAIGLLLRQRLSTILTFAALGQVSTLLSNKISDEAGVENFWGRLGIDFAVNLVAGISLESAWAIGRSLKNKGAQQAVKAIEPSIQMQAANSLYENGGNVKFKDIVKMQLVAETMSQMVGLGIIGAISGGKKLIDKIRDTDKELEEVLVE